MLKYRRQLLAIPAGAALGVAVWGVQRTLRLRAYREEVRRNTEQLREEDGWTADGYIRDQDCFYHRTYRTIPASGNGCGPVAAYNLRRRAGQEPDLTHVILELDAMHRLRAPGPTRMRVMRAYCGKYLPGFRELRGREKAIRAMEQGGMGVLRYHEEGVPHFIMWYGTAEGIRCFNVSEGEEDLTVSPAAFAEKHLRGGSVRMLWWQEPFAFAPKTQKARRT